MQAVTNAVNQANLYRYIAKPWEPTDLILTIKEAIRRYFQDKALEKQIHLLKNVNTSLKRKSKNARKHWKTSSRNCRPSMPAKINCSPLLQITFAPLYRTDRH